MSYVVLARKYRPKTFEDLVGQDHVAKTLAGAIHANRIAHAFLFTGVRGVGKTSSARLLARCLNCLGKDGQAAGPTSTPCLECAACQEIGRGQDMDVQEIDGASYNGVDEVRRLQESLQFRPARDRYKVYIVDEVHMLSNAAWNAFLKTLEEPPPHVKFIFATTEVHKVPVTILSRCQRYDFKLISTQQIAERLKNVLEAEEKPADDAAISIIAREAAGSMRDAMSLLDQVIAFDAERLTAETVARVIGVADRAVLGELATVVVDGHAKRVLEIVRDVSGGGYDLPHFARDFLEQLRALVVASVAGDDASKLLDTADEELDEIKALAERSKTDDLLRLFHGFSKSYDDIVRSGQPRAALEMTLVRLARRPPLLPIDELLRRLGDLEKRLSSGAPPPGGGRANARSAPRGALSRVETSAPTGGGVRGALALAASPSPHPRPQAVASPEALAVADMPYPVPESAPKLAELPRPAATAPKPVRSDFGLELDGELLARWRSVVDRARKDSPHVAALLEHGLVIALSPERARVAFERDSFLADQVSDPAALEILTRAVRAELDAPTDVGIDLGTAGLDSKKSLSFVLEREREARLAEARERVVEHPAIRDAIRVLGAKVDGVEVHDVDEPPPA